MSRHRNPGRRRAPGAVRRLPDGLRASARRGPSSPSPPSASWAEQPSRSRCPSTPARGRPDPRRARCHQLGRARRRPGSLPQLGPLRGPGNGHSGRLRPRRAPHRSPPSRSASPASRLSPSPSPSRSRSPSRSPRPRPPASGGDSAGAPSASYSTSISGKCGSIGLNSGAARLCSAVDSVFHLNSIGGYRANAGEHSTGQAVDLMISGRSQGDSVAAWVQAHAGEFNVKYVIWRQRYWEPGSSLGPHGGPRLTHREPHGPRARDGQLTLAAPPLNGSRRPPTARWAAFVSSP